MSTQLAGPDADEGTGVRRASRLGAAGLRRGLGDYRARLLTSGRYAGPALLGYAAVRAIGVIIVLLWHHKHGESGLHRLSTMWDAYWYADIAKHGYAGSKPVPGPHGPYQAYAFFPIYPKVIRACHLLLPLSVSQAALLAAWFASLVAAWGIFAVGNHLYGRRIGTIAAVLWGVTPYSLVESLAYSELMFTAFTTWAMYAAVRRRWILAGLLSTLAGLTRPTAVAVAGAVCLGALVALVSQWWRTRRGTMPQEARVAWWRPVVGGLFAPLGFVSFILWVGLQKHSLTGYFKVQEAWQSQFDYGSSTLQSVRDMLATSNTLWMSDVVVAITLMASVLLFVLSILQRQPIVLVALSALVLLLALGDASYFNSRARFLIPAFALLFPLAGALARVRTKGAVATVMAFAAVTSGLFGGYLAFVYTNSP